MQESDWAMSKGFQTKLWVTYNGTRYTLYELAAMPTAVMLGLNYFHLHRRIIKAAWPIAKALTTPVLTQKQVSDMGAAASVRSGHRIQDYAVAPDVARERMLKLHQNENMTEWRRKGQAAGVEALKEKRKLRRLARWL